MSLKNILNNFRDYTRENCKPQIRKFRFESQANVQTLPKILRRSETCHKRKRKLLYTYFQYKFQLSFRRPKTDTCDICDKFTIEIQHGSIEEKGKAENQ